MTNQISIAGVLDEIQSSGRGYENFITLCDDAGGRFSGTGGERLARDYIAGEVEKFGLEEVHLEPFEYLSWHRDEASIEVTAPVRRNLGALSLAYSPSTEAGGIEADLEFVPEPTGKCFSGMADDIEGKIVLTYIGKGVGPACQSTHWANAFGAEALVLMANHYGSLQPAGSCRWNQPGPLPVLSVSREEGEYLVRLLNRFEGATVKCHLHNTMEGGRGWNVVGEIPGSDRSGEQVVIGCHYDGFDIAQSAIDNASGTAAIMEVARALTRGGVSPERTLRFVWFGAEELGMIGSQAYVENHSREMGDVVAMITTDWPGSPASCGVQRPFTELSTHLERSLGGDIGSVSAGLGMYSDHFPFTLEGVPAMWIGGSITGRDLEIYHTVFDTADKVPPGVITDSAILMTRIIMELASTGEHPSRHRSGDEIRKLLEEEGRSKDLEIEGRWRNA